MDEAEEQISKVEDAVYTGKGKTEELIKQVDLLKHKLDNLENCLRRSNLRLVNLPDKAEKSSAIASLEKWLPEALGTKHLISPIKSPYYYISKLPRQSPSNASSQDQMQNTIRRARGHAFPGHICRATATEETL